jgi:hypothetical protein
MQRMILVGVLSCLVSACGGSGNTEPLVESECRAIQDKANEIVTAATGTDPSGMQGMGVSDDESVAMCAAGQSFNRDDYDCIMEADSMGTLNECTVQATEHMGS